MILRNVSHLKRSIREVAKKKKNKISSQYRCLSKKLEILVIRADKEGRLKSSKPCSHCMQTMKLFGIKNVYYSTDDGTIEKERLEDMTTNHISGGQKSLYKLMNRLKTKKS